MPNVDKHPQGHFCWIELHTSDRPGAVDFYTALFGWQPNHLPMGPNLIYTLFELNGRSNGAASQIMNPAELPNWQMFIAVDNADASHAKALSLSAEAITPVGDVGDYGRMSIVKDPSGAIFSLWEAKQHIGLGIIDEPGALCWGELYTTDKARSRQFYTDMFGWNYKGDGSYTEIHSGGKGIGGILDIKPEWKGMPPSWQPYFMTTDCAASIEKAKALGGQLHMGPQLIPNVGTIAMLADPQGAVFFFFEGSLRS